MLSIYIIKLCYVVVNRHHLPQKRVISYQLISIYLVLGCDMGKVLAIGFAVIFVILGFMLFPNLTSSIQTAQSNAYTETYSGVATGANITTANITLSLPLYGNDITGISVLTSDNTQDHPSTQLYTAATQNITVKSLLANSSRNITVKYLTEDNSEYVGLSSTFKIVPILVLLGILAIIAVVALKAFGKI